MIGLQKETFIMLDLVMQRAQKEVLPMTLAVDSIF